ncbi:flagellar motor switch protein [Buchnera aphidicola (Nipponaphis monzeni)]|uniref:Flagellar motor switch protein FliM n=1 Tax=Buchnera aphidicola (Nipponaphis monzeni) TaxID=2495405 RepID=A0A455T9U2_9GAMM|nr:FliM/FliN family flagellar motor switch protein [Buchnera aphidicola]BBI01080.1 flagellar motor switch protein [Buchnera aphidicola (Nipponaphis monzeni)]
MKKNTNILNFIKTNTSNKENIHNNFMVHNNYKHNNHAIIKEELNTKNIQLKSLDILEVIHKEFANDLNKKLLNLTNNTVKIQYLSNSMQFFEKCSKNVNNQTFNFVFNIKNFESFFYIIIPTNILELIINKVFGGNHMILNSSNIKLKSLSSKYIINDFIFKIKKSYKYAWGNEYYIYFKKKIYNIRIQHIKKNFQITKIFIHFYFRVYTNFWSNIFTISIPLNILQIIRQDIINKNILYKIDQDLDNTCIFQKKVSKNILNMLEICLIAQLNKFKLPILNLLKMKVGDIISIPNPDKILLYVNNIPILSGNLVVYSKKYAICISTYL